MTIYEDLGVETIVNACGWLTTIGGSLMSKETLEAMNQAAGDFVDMHELIGKVGEEIARILGVEAAWVSSGAAAGLVLSTAACITRKDRTKIKKLPNTEGMPNEVIMQSGHKVSFEQSIRTGGAKIVYVGLESGTEAWEMEGAINEKTVAIIHVINYVCAQRGMLPLAEVIRIGKRHNIPVIVDAAAEIPPIENLTKYVQMGADLALFSGGKGLEGPNNSGLIVGRKELVEAVSMNTFYPLSGVGRPMKLSKEVVVGLLAALKQSLKRDWNVVYKSWQDRVKYCIEELEQIPHVKLSYEYPTETGQPIPRAKLLLDEKNLGMTAFQVVEKLRQRKPSVWVRFQYQDLGIIMIDPTCLRDGQERIVAKALRETLAD